MSKKPNPYEPSRMQRGLPKAMAGVTAEVVKAVTAELEGKFAAAVARAEKAEAACEELRIALAPFAEAGEFIRARECSVDYMIADYGIGGTNKWEPWLAAAGILLGEIDPGQPLLDRLAAAERQVHALRECDTCQGVGALALPIGYDPLKGEQFGEPEECPECKGSGINEWATTMDRLAAAEAIVEKLPKTADGVPVVPGMSLWLLSRGEILQAKARGAWIGNSLDSAEVDTYPETDEEGSSWDTWLLRACYSTEQAAREAAKGTDHS